MTSSALRTLAAALVCSVALGLAGPASASWLQSRTQQEAIPLADAERSLVTGKSWLVAHVGFGYRFSNSHFIGDSLFNAGFTEGEHFELERNEGEWHYRRWDIGMTWGFSKNSDIWFRVPIVWAEVWNTRMVDAEGNRKPISAVGLGDVTGGIRFQWLRRVSPDGRFSNSLVTDLGVRFPTGNESPGSYIPGPNNVATIITGTGVWGFDIAVRFKQQIAVLALEAGLGFEINPTATVMYLVENEYNQFNQHIDPGDRVHFDFSLQVQPFDNLGLRGTVFLDYRTVTKWGSTVSEFPACKECVELPGSDGFWMDLEGRVVLDFDIHFGLDLYFRGSIAGRRNFLWPIEDLSPSRGFTAGLDVQTRF